MAAVSAEMVDAVTAAIRGSRRRPEYFEDLCACGGRFAGSDSETAAVAYLKNRIEADFGQPAEIFASPFDGWARRAQSLALLEGQGGRDLDCHALVWSPATPPGGIDAEVLDLGRGLPDDIHANADAVRGRIVLVRHEYMFASETMHRRWKYDAARKCGAAGFLIASHLPGDLLVTGSSGRNRAEDIPAAAITQEGAALLHPVGGALPRVRLTIETAVDGAAAESLLVDLPGETNERIVLSAHIDGHPLGESAIDNATGLAVALDVARILQPHLAGLRRGLRLCLFNLEEWGLAGSALYVDGLSQRARDAIALNINLDSVGGDARLTALTSEFPKVEEFLRSVPGGGVDELRFYRPLMRNSDHYNFARHGIPAFRLVAGFDDPASNLRYVLTPADRRGLVTELQLERAALLTARIALEACAARDLSLGNAS